MTLRDTLDQYFTPEWVAQALVERFYPGLGLWDQVIEPACGEGAFLRALPAPVPVLGVEIDPPLAAQAAASSGRPVLVGDFLTIDLPVKPTLVLGNPPFKGPVVAAFLERAWELLPNDGEVGFILPAFAFQTASTVDSWARRWGIDQQMMPRNVFPRLAHPLCFARFKKGRRGLVGFALYHEAAAVARLQVRYRALLAQGERSVWAAVTRAAVEALGGEASLAEIYREIEGVRPTTNRYWREKVRQQLQRVGRRVGPARWALRAALQ
ncbi:class I SAM-dependent methyltransferase [Achromobacter ruhlandii]|uniref:class I SAM-dependent methyltransferase n=1 Tax=Achromobacter ruhlandii TaxID=72557 RepID=UPI002DBACD55|nr:class I SAM-dependent methyltransferase [Achromobacter ruhlandii]MEB6663817.1 class I SAM-dependent methyltransferase [Achromobacter ruhlandii]